ncbi:peptidyl-prolyl cis-trans isomerase [sulfur-oxidizing endosymbiont of Gigantopelta aegis]|uniref:peptidylprolyl isomerase n=1 Tax=sulfur-oxidizing endosymbiont of Gigantopelta aegis TaxID=2794934 RepID=UPI0018DAFD84|nr:peptidylprolyl isomerase [sulfur-oxidizing endosymbiont of Gigantopelta aegis]
MKQSRLSYLLHEPLLHFLVIGAGLFVLFYQISDQQDTTEKVIIIHQADLDQLANTWIRNRGRPASAEEREHQLSQLIREKILYREAMALGLDKDDVIVRRRLARKMEYLFNDLSFIPEPTEVELNTYLTAHKDNYILPASISFEQIFLTPSKNNTQRATTILQQLRTDKEIVDSINLGDRSLLPYEFQDERKVEISRLFGDEFSLALFKLDLQQWQGPISSEYGEHLVFVHKRVSPRLPALVEIRDKLQRDWKDYQQAKANKLFYKNLSQRYEIILDLNESDKQ